MITYKIKDMSNYDLDYTGQAVDRILDTGYDLQNNGYMFRGVSNDYFGTPTEKVWLIAGEGSTGHGFINPVPKGCIGICMFNGSSWSTKTVEVVVMESPTNGSTNAAQSGAVYTIATEINAKLSSLTLEDTTAQIDEASKMVASLKMTTSGTPSILTSLTILAATVEKAGLLSAADKAKLDAILTNIRSMVVVDTTAQADEGDEITETIKWTVNGAQEVISAFTILAATTEKAGLLSADDKKKIDSFIDILDSMDFDDTTASADQGEKIEESVYITVDHNDQVIAKLTLLAATSSKAGLLSASDKAKIDALASEGYLFAGVATPSGTPATTTGKVFYLAVEAGTYTNYGNISLPNGINVITKNGSTWTGISIVGIDDKPTKDSTALAESGDLYDVMEESAQNTSDISQLESIEASSTVTGKYIKADGTVAEHESYQYQVFPVTAGSKYTFSCKFNGGSLYIIHWFNGNEYIGCESYQTGGSGVTVQYKDKVLIAPENADTCIMNESISQYNSGYYDFKEVLDTIKSRDLLNAINVNATAIGNTRGGYFIHDDCIIKTSDGALDENHSGMKATMFLPITGKEPIIGRNLWTNGTTIAMIAFYDDGKNFISVWNDFSANQQDFVIAVEDIPAGAKFIRASANFLREGPHTIIGGVDLASIIEYQEATEGDVAVVKDAIMQNICTPLPIYNTLQGGFIKSDGSFIEHSSYHVDIFEVEGNGLYAFSGTFNSGASLIFVSWFDENSEFIKPEPYHGSTTEATAFVNQVVKAPSNAAYLYLNVMTSRSSYFNASSVVQQIIKSSDLKEELDGINADVGRMKVTVEGDNTSVRTALNSEKDIIIKFGRDGNGNISPKNTLIGNTDDYDADFVEIHKWSDSTMPLRSVPQFWHLYAQHGIPIPLVTVTDNPLTTDDVGSWWQDQESRQYQVGKVAGDKIYLIPRVVQSGTQGIVTRDWRDATHDTYPSELQHVSGGVHTDTLTVSAASQYQVEPIQESSNKKFTCDGKDVGNGTYYCDEFVISETLTCLDVTVMTSYFPTPKSTRDALVITNSFIFKELSIGFNQLVNCVNPVQFGYYGSNQAQHLADIDGMDAYVLIPKVKKNNSAGSIMNKFFRSQDSDANVTVYRTSDDLVDIDRLPDRQLSVLKDDGTPVLGFASGVSLVRGVTVDEVRNTFIAKSSGSAGNALLFSPTNNNKFYVGVISAFNTEKFTDRLMQTDFCKEFSTYYSYFMPTDDVQAYYYNDGSSTVIYIHAESNTGRVLVDVGKADCEGKSIEVVEKTDDVTLYSDSIVNGKICVDFESADANYIVLVAK